MRDHKNMCYFPDAQTCGVLQATKKGVCSRIVYNVHIYYNNRCRLVRFVCPKINKNTSIELILFKKKLSADFTIISNYYVFVKKIIEIIDKLAIGGAL